MPPISNKVLQKLDKVDDWPGLIKKMIGYGIWLAKVEYKWQAGTILPKGHDIKDLVYTVVQKLYGGERTWVPSNVSLETWLRGNIRSEMNNLFKSAYTHSGTLREVPLEVDDTSRTTDEFEHQVADGEALGHKTANPEAVLLEKERKERRKLMIEALYKAIEGDEILEKIYYEILDGYDRKPRILAQRLAVPKKDINNALRRLDRHLEKITRQGSDNE